MPLPAPQAHQANGVSSEYIDIEADLSDRDSNANAHARTDRDPPSTSPPTPALAPARTRRSIASAAPRAGSSPNHDHDHDAELPIASSQRLVVTSQLPAFWRTKWGYVLGVVALLAVVGGIVGGVLGNKSNDEPARNPGSVHTTMSSSSSGVSSGMMPAQSTTDVMENPEIPHTVVMAAVTANPIKGLNAVVTATTVPLASSIPNPPGRNLLRYAYAAPLVS
ncbi:hypothetical protein JR316_0010481 [Psilocybe cubensis]|uniref:Uncharacterized protein n=2 Tax=Psilocybe cubensis TaxID=181762 RepID=A0A8H8CEM1_PSICU|nr:hypothetical protein JR316_0010481 [Psilocybe cubensis]KAH9476569.1 hypothetical protein JR316_0010481 [Psilocybe cubensis]